MKHVLIIGAGIAGLTAAHELVEQGYHVTLLERNDVVGGLARTYQDKETKTCPYEYSWRAFGAYYHNVYNMMQRIPFQEKGFVFDQMIEVNKGDPTCQKGTSVAAEKNFLQYLPTTDILKIVPTILRYSLSCDERNIDLFAPQGLREFIHTLDLTKETEDVIGKSVGPYLGFDYHNASVYDLLYFNEISSNNSPKKFKLNISALPTNYVWFDPWVKLLKGKGVQLLVNTEVTSIAINNNKITSVVTRNTESHQSQTLTADFVVNCTGPEVLTALLEPYKLSPSIGTYYTQIKTCAENGRQIQMSVYYYLDKKIFFETVNSCIYLPNTPWLLMVLPTGHIWGDEHMKEFCVPEIKEILSIGICEPYEKGLFIKKPWSECTREEIELETWHQLIHDKDFIKSACIQDNTDIADINIINFKMWDSFVYKDGKLDTYEPKWANNINTKQYRPGAATPISNLFIGGAFSNTATGIYSMESATESGKVAAKAVCKYDNVKDTIFLHIKQKSIWTAPIRYLDSLLYNHMYYFIALIICVCLLWYTIPWSSIGKVLLSKLYNSVYRNRNRNP